MPSSLRTPFESVGRRAVAPVLLILLAGFPLAAQPPEQPPVAGASGFGAGAGDDAGHRGGGTCRCPWSEERARVVDLMLDGAFADALARSEELLADPALPAPVARRIAELRTRAVRALERRDLQRPELERGGPERPGLERPDPVAAAPAPQPEPRSRSDRPPPLDVTFRVRATRPGRSFRDGDDGRLRVSAHGITFVPDDGGDGGRWTVPWEAFASASEADGIWDVAHPLVVRTEEGALFFLVKIGPEDRFGDGEQILRYIEKGRKRFTGSRGEESG